MALASLAHRFSQHSKAPSMKTQGAPAAQNEKPNGFEMLTRYIPTETITLYVGAMAARDDIAHAFGLGSSAVSTIYWVFAALTPIILALLLLGRARLGEPRTAKLHWWPLTAATIAFMVWALSVPGHPVADAWKMLPAFGALLVSTFLSLLEPIFGPKK